MPACQSILFQPCHIGTYTLKNRLVRSATGEARADKDGILKDNIFPIYERLAAGGVGLIITGHMYVHPDWKCSPAQTGAWSDRHLPGLTRLAQTSKLNGARAIAQINSAGRPPAELTAADINDVIDRFVAAGARVISAGFDGVQIHAAHGYLLSGFLTPAANQRSDQYGLDAAGRRRLLLEIALRLRAAIGPDRMLLCKLGAMDGRDNSLPLAETLTTAVALQDAGVDSIEVSCTFPGPHANPVAEHINADSDEAYFAAAAAAIRSQVRIPVMLVGGLRSLSVMERLVSGGTCDLASLCRPFIREPDLANRFAAGGQARAACISCNQCFNRRGFRCVFAVPDGSDPQPD